jgi:hypothetical protein
MKRSAFGKAAGTDEAVVADFAQDAAFSKIETPLAQRPAVPVHDPSLDGIAPLMLVPGQQPDLPPQMSAHAEEK